MRRPLTARERLHVRVNMLASEALRLVHVHRISLVEGKLQGLSKHGCPGWHMGCNPCACGKPHEYAHTNHNRMRT